MELKRGFYLSDFSFLPQQRNQTVDILVMVLDDLGVFEEDLFLLCVAGFVLQEGCGKLAENIGVLAHYDACLYIFLFLLWLYLVLLHICQRINIIPSTIGTTSSSNSSVQLLISDDQFENKLAANQ